MDGERVPKIRRTLELSPPTSSANMPPKGTVHIPVARLRSSAIPVRLSPASATPSSVCDSIREWFHGSEGSCLPIIQVV